MLVLFMKWGMQIGTANAQEGGNDAYYQSKAHFLFGD